MWRRGLSQSGNETTSIYIYHKIDRDSNLRTLPTVHPCLFQTA
ncbi:MAG: hypothetical protein ACI90V_014437 [Bacillariaceae sp.]|jgi:hypothetical protein